MIVEGNNKLRNVHGLSREDTIAAMDFIHSLVKIWFIGRQPNNTFRAVDLMGKHIFDTWANTPLHPLYMLYYGRTHDDAYATRQAGIAAGYLLKQVISADPHRFRFNRGFKNSYTLL